MNNILTKDAILQVDDLKRERVDVSEWNGYVYVRTMTGAERDAYEASLFEPDPLDPKKMVRKADFTVFRLTLLTRTICDQDGTRLFEDDDTGFLGSKASKPLQTIFEAAMKLNGMTGEDVEDLTKNSESDQKEDSTSA